MIHREEARRPTGRLGAESQHAQTQTGHSRVSLTCFVKAVHQAHLQATKEQGGMGTDEQTLRRHTV
jgi:hypothetical protein